MPAPRAHVAGSGCPRCGGWLSHGRCVFHGVGVGQGRSVSWVNKVLMVAAGAVGRLPGVWPFAASLGAAIASMVQRCVVCHSSTGDCDRSTNPSPTERTVGCVAKSGRAGEAASKFGAAKDLHRQGWRLVAARSLQALRLGEAGDGRGRPCRQRTCPKVLFELTDHV